MRLIMGHYLAMRKLFRFDTLAYSLSASLFMEVFISFYKYGYYCFFLFVLFHFLFWPIMHVHPGMF